MKEKVLLIDDKRTFVKCTIARTFDEGLHLIQTEQWDTLLLDNDLGDEDPRKEGYYILNWIEEHPEHKPGKVIVVSSNPPARKRIKLALQKIYPEGNFVV